MERTPVESSLIASVGYDAATRVTEIEFTRGGVYTYPDVDPETHAALIGAESVGKYFLHQFKVTHVGTKVPPPEPVQEA